MAPATYDEQKQRSLFPVYDGTIPVIVNITAEDVDNADSVYSAGDVITVHFSGPTDRGARSGGKAYVDRLFRPRS